MINEGGAGKSGFFYVCYNRRGPLVTLDEMYHTLAMGKPL